MSETVNPFIPNPDATGIARIFRRAVDLPILRNDELVFPPDDNWTLGLAESIVRLAERGYLNGKEINGPGSNADPAKGGKREPKKLLEIGCGTGVNILGIFATKHLIDVFPEIVVSDIAPESVKITQAQVHAHGFSDHVQFYQSNLLDSIPEQELEDVDIVFACLPQVLWPWHTMNCAPEDRQFADYIVVPKDQIPTAQDMRGLSLIDEALRQIREKSPKASIVFNLTGRQGVHVTEMLEKHGFTNIERLVHRIIPHDPETDISAFALREAQSDDRFIFYKDEQATEQITATQAEERRQEKKPVYHDLYVIHASPELDLAA